MAFNVLRFGAVPDLSEYDGTDNGPAIQNALDAVAAAGGGTLIIPGRFKVVGQLVIKSSVRIIGETSAGGLASLTQIHVDRSSFITNSPPGEVAPFDISIENIEIASDWGRNGNFNLSNHLVEIIECGRVTAYRTRFLNSSEMCFVVTNAKYAAAIECELLRSWADGIHITGTPTALVSACRFRDINDDAIAIHTTDSAPSPVETQTVVIGNDIQDSQGIAILGAKNTIITGNSLKRVQTRGIYVGVGGDTTEGNTTALSVVISSNVIDTIFDATIFYPDAGGLLAPIVIDAAPLSAAASGGYVGEADGDGKIVLPWPYLFKNNTDEVPPVTGQFNISVTGNVVVSSLQPATSYSDYGYGPRYGSNGPVDPPVSAANLGKGSASNACILLRAVSYAEVSNNLLGDLSYGILLEGGPTANENFLSQKGVKIAGGSISRFGSAGICMFGTGDVSVEGVTFDGDPYCTHPQRSADGSWTGSWNANVALNIVDNGAQTANGRINVKGCNFRNVGTVTDNPVEWYNWQSNTVFCDPAVPNGYDVRNIGIGRMRGGAEIDAIQVVEGGNPEDAASFRHIKNNCLRAAATPPTSGKYVEGHVVTNLSPLPIGPAGSQYEVIGWRCLTTGAVSSISDWREIRNLTGS